jgi:hypothetical protein
MSCPMFRATACSSRVAGSSVGLFGLTRTDRDKQFAQQLQPLGPERSSNHRDAGEVATRPIEALNEAKRNRVTSCRKYDRQRGGYDFYCAACDIGGANKDDSHFAFNELGCQQRQTIKSSVRPAEFDQKVSAFDKTAFVQSLSESRHQVSVGVEWPAAEEADHRHCGLLRARGERPCRRAAKQRD